MTYFHNNRIYYNKENKFYKFITREWDDYTRRHELLYVMHNTEGKRVLLKQSETYGFRSAETNVQVTNENGEYLTFYGNWRKPSSFFNLKKALKLWKSKPSSFDGAKVSLLLGPKLVHDDFTKNFKIWAAYRGSENLTPGVETFVRKNQAFEFNELVVGHCNDNLRESGFLDHASKKNIRYKKLSGRRSSVRKYVVATKDETDSIVLRMFFSDSHFINKQTIDLIRNYTAIKGLFEPVDLFTKL